MDITTSYLGFKLKSPIVPSAGPLSEDVSKIKEMEDAGAGAAVIYSLFEEQLEHDELELDHHTSTPAESFAEATSYFPEPFEYRCRPAKGASQTNGARHGSSHFSGSQPCERPF